jgi:hypothetical protein
MFEMLENVCKMFEMLEMLENEYIINILLCLLFIIIKTHDHIISTRTLSYNRKC